MEFRLREMWRVGGLDAPPEEQFTGPHLATAFGPAGQATVVDPLQAKVSIFDGRTGRFIHAFGNSGRGPGEMREPGGLAWRTDTRLWVENIIDGRYTVFDPRGEVVKIVHRRPHGVNRLVFPLVFTEEGVLLDHSMSGLSLMLLRLDTLAVVLDSLRIRFPEMAVPGGPIMPGSRLHDAVGLLPSLRWAFDPDGRSAWTVRTDSLILVRLSFSGDTLLRVATHHRTARFTPEQEVAVRRANHELGGDGGFVPILCQSIHVLEDGRILVQVGSEPREPGREFDVFSHDGMLLGTLHSQYAIPPRSQMASRGDTLLFEALGPLDVPLVVKAVLERPN